MIHQVKVQVVVNKTDQTSGVVKIQDKQGKIVSLGYSSNNHWPRINWHFWYRQDETLETAINVEAQYAAIYSEYLLDSDKLSLKRFKENSPLIFDYRCVTDRGSEDGLKSVWFYGIPNPKNDYGHYDVSLVSRCADLNFKELMSTLTAVIEQNYI